jgi:hypothetical protein
MGMATGYGWTFRDSNPGKIKELSPVPNVQIGSYLMGAEVLPGGKANGAWREPRT